MSGTFICELGRHFVSDAYQRVTVRLEIRSVLSQHSHRIQTWKRACRPCAEAFVDRQLGPVVEAVEGQEAML